MKCRCGASLGGVNARGEPIVRTRGMIFKADGIVMACPKCKGDVEITADLAKAMQGRLVLFFSKKAAP